ncbi:hypothetical protein LK12_17160 [Novosphingobium malaysiense]|uniref:SMP-30/Gluconolactonase/LRE-like region domain-containing protein n=1 Tax=Novosphingobium malaysiense TaxID=1348853 RepID=A0A0B1ZII2_9SPHN|nr:hypothetical protein LK12_17160 [Novosphingobium malaysiense]
MPAKLCADGLVLPEGPRWRDGELIFSDMFGHRVAALSGCGVVTTLARVTQQPSGLGWLPDGRLIVVSMLDRKIRVVGKDGSADVLVSIGDCAVDRCNDMVVDARGWAYVGSFPASQGATAWERIDNSPMAAVACVDFRDLDNIRVNIAATGLHMPNGMVISEDGRTLIVAETAGRRLTAFDIDQDGGLANRRVWADLPIRPDGICLDVQGAIWVATPLDQPAFLHVREGGEVIATVDGDGLGGFACELGGEDGRTLFLLEAPYPVQPDAPLGRIRSVRVDVPGIRKSDGNAQ